MALHPQLLQGTGKDFVYVAYTYDADPTAGVKRRTKIRRYTYNPSTETLGSPCDLIKNLPAGYGGNPERLKIGPDLKLYYTIGDLGANQGGVTQCDPVRSQEVPSAVEVLKRDWTKYQGGILRLNLDGSIPFTNPLFSGVISHIYTRGHRNAQGIVFGPDGKLYADEHGPKTDDEINIIRAGKNYGWPHVVGYKDDQAYVYGNWSASSPTPCASLTYSSYTIPPSVPTYTESSWTDPDFVAPIKTLYTVENGHNFQDPACAGNYGICWPSVAPSSLDIYTKTTGGIPGWANSLLVISLKTGGMYRLKLSADGNSTVGDVVGYWFTQNRYRDVALNPDGVTFYVATDNYGWFGGPKTGPTKTLNNPGAILEFQYTGIIER
jgi:PQQ-dependent dehydrogenase (s-GDH family)